MNLNGWLFAGIVVLALVSQKAMSLPADVKTIAKPTALYELPRKNLYAIGIAEAPAGASITIVNGNIYVAYDDQKKKLVVDTSMKTVAQKLAYAVVRSWIEIPLPLKIQTADEVGAEVSKALKKLGFENARNVPFLLKGKFHIVPANAKLSGLAIGLFTKTTPARVEPETYSIVWNFVAENNAVVGTIEKLSFTSADHVTLFLPR
ncbi:hypothetical protein BH10BDE1_BH10BDE1_05230 [soil metagenome]